MRNLIIVVALFPMAVLAAALGNLDVESLFPGVELVEKSEFDTNRHLVVLGALEKVNREVEPEASTIVTGERQSATYYLPEARRTKEVASILKSELESYGLLQYECRGRTCGSSSYWANRIFDRAILYGPEQYQQYLVAQSNDKDSYLAVYVGKRATGKIYVHVEYIRLAN